MTGLRLLPVSALMLAACAPQNATLVSGDYMAFVADGSSLSLQKKKVVPEKYKDNYVLDCRTFDNGGFLSEEDEAALRLEDTIKICGEDQWPPEHEEWAVQAGYYVVSEKLEPWRGQAIITSEGDLQIAFHHRVPGGADLRFVIAVDPDFGPTTCDFNNQGEYEIVPKDGDWVEHWSRGTDEFPQGLAYIESLPDDNDYRAAFDHFEPYLDGKLFLINDGSYQINPSQVDDFWYFPDYWEGASAQGKFVEEDVNNRAPRYADPWVYNYVDVTDGYYAPAITPNDLWYCGGLTEESNPEQDPCMIQLDERVKNTASEIEQELSRMMSPTGKPADAIFHYAPISHTNMWRKPDGRGAGLDGWGELHYNYIVFSKDSDLSVGGSAKGAFSLVYDALESSTRWFVKGEFEIEKIKKDRWVTDDLEEEKLIENDVELCNAASIHEADPKDNPDPALE